METSEKVLLSRFAMEIVTAVIVAGIGLMLCYGANEAGTGWSEAGPQSGYFPYYMGILAVFSGVGNFIAAFIKYRRDGEAFLTAGQFSQVFSFFWPMLAFVVLASFLGLYVSLALYLVATMVLQGKYRIHIALAVGIAAPIIFYFIFDIWFQTPLLKGPLERLLGIY